MNQDERSDAESQASNTPAREGLVRELDEVIRETRARISSDVEELKRLAHRISKDWNTYRSSVQVRNTFAPGDPIEPEFIDIYRSITRMLSDLERPREERTLRPARAYGGVPAGETRAPMPSDRLEQIRRVFLRNQGLPMGTGQITEAMELRGWLKEVADARATVSAALSRGARLGVLERVSRGTYQLASPEEEQGRRSDGGDQGQSTSNAGKENDPS